MDKWLSHPTVMKVVALALGIIMWAVVHFDNDSPTPTTTVSSSVERKTFNDVKVQMYGLNDRNYVLQSMEPESVKLIVQGDKSDLLRATTEDYLVRVDLSTVTAGQHTLKLQADLPRGVELVSMTPENVTVNVEELQTKEFEVQILPKGTPAQGLKAGVPVLRPTNRVHVTLPSSKLAKVDHVGGAISVEGLSETLKNKDVKLAAYDASGAVIAGAVLDPAVVEVDVPITNPYKTVPIQFKLVGKMPAGLSISSFKPETEQATIYGPQSALDGVEFVEADVQLGTLTQSGKVEVELQKVGQITEISPANVIVDAEVVLSQTRVLQELPVTIEGLGMGLSMKITDPPSQKVDITMQGAPSVLDSLQPGDVDVVADLSGRGPGTYTIPIVVNSPRFVDQVGGNVSITVEITSTADASAPPADGAAADGGSDAGAGEAAGTTPSAGASASGDAAAAGATADGGGSAESPPPAG